VAILSADALLGAPDLKEEVVAVPEWGGEVKVRGLSLGDYQEIQDKSTVRGEVDGNKLSVYLCIAGMVEPKLGWDQYEQLRGKSLPALNRVAGAVMRLSGLGSDAIEAAEATFPDAAGDDAAVPAGEGSGHDGGGAR
jgi:hypothetical protein